MPIPVKLLQYLGHLTTAFRKYNVIKPEVYSVSTKSALYRIAYKTGMWTFLITCIVLLTSVGRVAGTGFCRTAIHTSAPGVGWLLILVTSEDTWHGTTATDHIVTVEIEIQPVSLP